jgi:hypothetical protein
MARGFKTGGRNRGTPNKRSAELTKAIEQSGESPLQYMLRVMRDENAAPERRDQMAKWADVHPRLAAIEAKEDGPIHPPIHVEVTYVPGGPDPDRPAGRWELRDGSSAPADASSIDTVPRSQPPGP